LGRKGPTNKRGEKGAQKCCKKERKKRLGGSEKQITTRWRGKKARGRSQGGAWWENVENVVVKRSTGKTPGPHKGGARKFVNKCSKGDPRKKGEGGIAKKRQGERVENFWQHSQKRQKIDVEKKGIRALFPRWKKGGIKREFRRETRPLKREQKKKRFWELVKVPKRGEKRRVGGHAKS